MTKQNMGGKKHINPLKRTNSQIIKKEDPISDNYSFYMFHLKDRKAKAKSELTVPAEYQTKSQKEIVLKTR